MYKSAIFVLFSSVIFESINLVELSYPYCPPLRLKNGRTRTRHRGRFVRFFCNSGYTLAGERYATCERTGWDAPAPKCVRASCSKNVQPPANGLIYPSHNGAVLNFYCKSGYSVLGPKATFCDGRKWDNNLPTCVPKNDSKPKTFCDFESDDICGWSHDLNHDFDWRRENFRTPSGSIGTGPSFDHTKGKGQDGYYMYIESSSRSENDTARLISPVFERTVDDTCFNFFYHMYGITTGTLRVYLKKISEEWDFTNLDPFFEKSGNQGDKWYRGYFNLGPISDDYQIIIEGVRGPGYISDIAIDDVKIINHCVFVELTTTTEESYSPETEQSLATVESCENRCGEKAFGNESSTVITCDCDDGCYDNNRCCPDYLDICISATTTYTDVFYTTTELANEIPPQEENKTPTKIIRSTVQPTTKTTTKSTTELKEIVKTTLRIETTTKIVETTPKMATTTLKTVKTTPKTTIKTTRKLPKTTVKQKTTIKAKIRTPLVIILPPTTPIIVRKVLNKTTVKPKQIKTTAVTEKQKENEVLKKKNPAPNLNDDEISLTDDYDNFDYHEQMHFNEKNEIFVLNNVQEHKMSTLSIVSICVGILVCTGVLTGFFLKYYKSRRLRNRSGASRSQSDVRFLTEDEVLDFSLDDREKDDDLFHL